MSGLARISTELWIALAAFACFAIIGLLQYGGQQRTLERYDTFSSYDYQPGGYRAWYDLLAHEGVRVQRFERRPAYLNDAVNTLIVANNILDAIARSENGQPAGFFASGDYTALARWVKNGGHLIWLTDSANAIFTTALQRVSSGNADPSDALRLPQIARSDLKNDEAIAVTASPLTAGVHAVSGSARQRIPFANSAAVLPLVADDSGATVAWYPLGKGDIIVVTDESLFQNSRLAKADNARLSYDLVAAGLRPGALVAFDEWSHGHQSGDTWWTILPRPMQWAFAIFCGAVILALAGSAIRFGPAVRLSHNTERTSEEYVRSMAQLMRRAGATRKAVRDLGPARPSSGGKVAGFSRCRSGFARGRTSAGQRARRAHRRYAADPRPVGRVRTTDAGRTRAGGRSLLPLTKGIPTSWRLACSVSPLG